MKKKIVAMLSIMFVLLSSLDASNNTNVKIKVNLTPCIIYGINNGIFDEIKGYKVYEKQKVCNQNIEDYFIGYLKGKKYGNTLLVKHGRIDKSEKSSQFLFTQKQMSLSNLAIVISNHYSNKYYGDNKTIDGMNSKTINSFLK